MRSNFAACGQVHGHEGAENRGGGICSYLRQPETGKEKMLQQWEESSGPGSSRSGIAQPVGSGIVTKDGRKVWPR